MPADGGGAAKRGHEAEDETDGEHEVEDEGDGGVVLGESAIVFPDDDANISRPGGASPTAISGRFSRSGSSGEQRRGAKYDDDQEQEEEEDEDVLGGGGDGIPSKEQLDSSSSSGTQTGR